MFVRAPPGVRGATSGLPGSLCLVADLPPSELETSGSIAAMICSLDRAGRA